MAEPAPTNIFTVEKLCPVCGKKTRVTKPKTRLSLIKTDWDFCTHYRDFNPYLYVPWVCEHCCYAADERRFSAPMNEATRNRFRLFLERRKIGFKYSVERQLPDAVAAFRLAIFFEEMAPSSFAYRAGLYLKSAWLYRVAGDQDNEIPNLEKAAAYYDKSVMTERYPIGNLTDGTAMYLVGAIYFELGEIDKATQYVSRLVNDRYLKSSEPKIFEKVRQLWTEIREIKPE